MEFLALIRKGPNHSDRAARNVSFWLEELPEQLCEQIVAWVSIRKPTDDLFSLASSTAKMQHTVAKVLRFKYDLNWFFNDPKKALKWAQLLSPFVKDVVLDRTYDRFSRNDDGFRKCVEQKAIFQLFLSPYLQRWYVSFHTRKLLNGLAEQSWSHVEKSLKIDKDQYSSRYLIKIVKALSPKHLILSIQHDAIMRICNMAFESERAGDPQPWDHTGTFSSMASVGGETISNPRTLEKNVPIYRSDITLDQSSLSLFADETGVLREGWNITFADHVLDLSKNPGDLRRVLQACRLIGDSLSRLLTFFPFSAFKRLVDACPNLEDIHLDLENGQETELANALPMLPKLHAVGLRFDLQGRERYPDRCKTNSNAMLQLVRRCKKLRELRLFGGYIEKDKVGLIFQEFGRRLLRFRYDCSAHAPEWTDCYDYIYATAVAAFAHCPQLCFAEVIAPGIKPTFDVEPDGAKRRRRDDKVLPGTVLARRMKLITPEPPKLTDSDLFSSDSFFSLWLRTTPSGSY